MNSLDDIINCSIEISDTLPASESYSTILIIVPEPAENEVKDNVIEINRLDDLAAYGFTVNDAAYKASKLAFSQSPSPKALYIAARKKIDGDVYEPVTAVLERADDKCSWYGVHLTSFNTVNDLKEAAEWCEVHTKLFGIETKDSMLWEKSSYFRTFAIYSGVMEEYAALAWMVKCFGYEPGSETWAFKKLAGILPADIDRLLKKELDKKYISYYTVYAGKNITSESSGRVLSGEWIDVIRFRDWLKNNVQTKVFGILYENKKIPYNDAGITSVQNQVIAALKEGQLAGGIDEDMYDADGKKVPGFTVTVPRAAEISATQRASRKLTGCRFTARLAGAIHVVEISGSLTY